MRTKKPLTTRTCALATILEPNEEKRQSLLTLHARGYCVESNSQGSCSICISLEKEDKLDQRLTKALWIVECIFNLDHTRMRLREQ